MADEIKIQALLEITNGSFKLPRIGTAVQNIDQAAQGGGVPGTVSIPTTAVGTAPNLTELGTLGWVRMVNLDLTNFVSFGVFAGAIFNPVGRMKPGEPALFRLEPGIDFRLRADTASVEVQILANED